MKEQNRQIRILEKSLDNSEISVDYVCFTETTEPNSEVIMGLTSEKRPLVGKTQKQLVMKPSL